MDVSRISATALSVLSRLEKAGYEAYLVGGCVRDLLRGVVPHDFDVATSALPEQTLEVFKKFRTVETGLSHGTVTVLVEGEPIEVTTYRVDGEYSDRRRPDSVSFTPCLAEDLARRDFTVNAMAYSPTRGFCDPFDGGRDLDSCVLRAVGDPFRRFSEDALRILRALRFSATLGFSIEPQTVRAAEALAGTVSAVAPERIREEIFKLLLGNFASRVLSAHRGILADILPEVPCAEAFPLLPPDVALRVAAWLLPCRTPELLLKRLRADNATTLAVLSILRLYRDGIPKDCGNLCRLMRREGEGNVARAITLRRACGLPDDGAEVMLRRILDTGMPYLLSHIAIDGNMLKAVGIPAGKTLGRILEALYGAVIDGISPNEPGALLELARTLYKKEQVT